MVDQTTHIGHNRFAGIGGKPHITQHERTTTVAQSKSRGPESDVIYVPFTKEAFDDAQRMADAEKKPLGRVIQESLAVKRWVSDVQNQGGKVVGEKRGKRTELSFK
jgi:hypothetical protein